MSAAFGWGNNFAGASLTTAFGGNTSAIAFDSAYPAANVLDPDPSKVARVNYTRSGTGTVFTVGFAFAGSAGAQRTSRLVAFLNLRLPPDCTVVNVSHAEHDYSPSQGVNYTAANLVPIPGTTDRYNLYFLDTLDRTYGALLLTVTVPINTSGYIEAGYVWSSPALVFDEGVGSGWGITPIDPSEVERARGGGFAAQLLPRRRRLRAQISERDYNPMLGTPGNAAALSMRRFLMEAGVSSPVIAIPRTSDQHALQVGGVYGLIGDLREIGHQGGNYFATEVSVEEIR